MASATLKTAHITKLIPVETEVKTVELSLTLQEAELLRTLLGVHVQGTGPIRDIANDIWSSLYCSGSTFRHGLFTGYVFCSTEKDA